MERVTDGNRCYLAVEDDDTLVSRLCELDGVGRWSAEYIMLRGFSRMNIFPGDDVGAHNKLRQWLSIAPRLDYLSSRHDRPALASQVLKN